MSVVLGVDVGGTKVAVGPVDASGAILAPLLQEPSVVSDTESFVDGLVETLRGAIGQFGSFEPKAIGLACAGTVDEARRLVVTSPNLPLRRVPLAESLQASLGLQIVLENDANAALLAEATVGVAAGLRDVILLTLGTGVGGGILINGRLYRGVGGGAGELGHTVVCGGGELCRCGARGCLEMYASGRALARFADERAGSEVEDPDRVLARMSERHRLDGRTVGRLATRGYPGALSAARELAIWLGRGLVSLVNAFNPEMIVIGGGVADLGEILLEPARGYVREKAMSPNKDQVQIVQASLGNSAGMVGAGLVAWEVCG
ncbi:MAG: ROK family protein [Actinobacteria bacterium]|nr:ROK family protein [Actinomycetota bacterium]